MTFTIYRVCAHCAYSDAIAEDIDVLVCTLSMFPWTCSECGRLVSYVIKPAVDVDSN